MKSIKLLNIINELNINKPDIISKNDINLINDIIIIYIKSEIKNYDYNDFDVMDNDILLYSEELKEIIYNNVDIDIEQIDDDYIINFFNEYIIPVITPKLWKAYWDNLDLNKIRNNLIKKIKKRNYDIEDLFWLNIDPYVFDDTYPSFVVEPYLYNIIYQTILNYDTENLNELEINKPVSMYPFRNNSYEKGLTISDTIKNFIKANPFQPEGIIVDSIASKRWYASKYIMDNMRRVLNQGVLRKQVINPNTKRKIWVYYIPQGSLFELGINNPNITAENAFEYYRNNILKSADIRSDSLYSYFDNIKNKYVEKYREKIKSLDLFDGSNDDLIFTLDLLKILSRSDLNQFYREMQQLVKKYVKN